MDATPSTSNLDFVPGLTIANHAIAVQEEVMAFYNSNGNTHLAVRVAGRPKR